MGVHSFPSPRETVIVVMDANSNKANVDALDWALKHVVRPRDRVVVLGVLREFGKKTSCFPLNMGISISGIWEKLEFSGQGEVKPREVEEEIDRNKEQYQSTLQPFYRQCKKNEVKFEVKLAAGYCPMKITVEETQKANPRWIVLDSHLKEHKVAIYEHVGCNLAVMKGKGVATLMPSRAPQVENFSATPLPQSACWCPLSWRSDFSQAFSYSKLEKTTNGFADENVVQHMDNEFSGVDFWAQNLCCGFIWVKFPNLVRTHVRNGFLAKNDAK